MVGAERFVEDNLTMRRRRKGGRLQNGSCIVVHQVLAGEYEFAHKTKIEMRANRLVLFPFTFHLQPAMDFPVE